LQSTAAFYLGLVQAAFETLVEPSRRLGYDLSTAGDPDSDCDEAVISDGDRADPSSAASYESRLQEQYSLLMQRESRATTDLGLRVDALTKGSRRQGSGLQLLDFSLRKSATVGFPSLGRLLKRAALLSQRLEAKGTLQSVRFADPTVTITGGTHGLLDGPYKLAPLLLDRYQPPGPLIHGPRRMDQLLASRFLPLLQLNLRQELSWRTQDSSRPGPDLVVEQELELLPQPSTTTRIGHSIRLPGQHEPLGVEVSVTQALQRRVNVAPSVGLAVHRAVGSGTAFIVADGGDWNLRTSKECRELSRFSKISGSLAPVTDVFRNPPTLEVGYALGRQDLGIQSGQAFTKPAERGLQSLDSDLDERKPTSWSVSAGFTPGNIAAYLRYGRDLAFSSHTTTTSPSPSHRRPHSRHTSSLLRAEVELAGITAQQRDISIAFRALARVGRFSKLGLELALSPANLHLSLYWSRLGQRLSVPFLVAGGTHRSSFRLLASSSMRLLFWTTVLPFATLAAWNLYRQRRHLQHRSCSSPSPCSTSSPNNTTISKNTGNATTTTATKDSDPRVQAHISRRRAEADELTVLFATTVEPRRGGLVVLSAKYGARDAPPDEVADVTIAVAALLPGRGHVHVHDPRHAESSSGGTSNATGERGEQVVIPAGLRKGRLLGFWDPAPLRRGEDKVLRVRYLWEGTEREVEVWGRDELRLPC
jgi:DnaJ family protein C protein 11